MFGLFGTLYGRSSKWKYVRSEHIKNYPECAACGRKTGLDVHHIKPYHINPELELDPNNLITLCDKYCHFVFGHLMDWKSWNENVREDCDEFLQKKMNRPNSDIFGSQHKGYKNAILNFVCNYMFWPFTNIRWDD